ncbi:hypothetical protein BO71DRAFT_101441 [Aspergillus ellipticus CBS 707.79]|uniref:Uncharacterized protein n=1 Tax=Aspergillus ellipticus CBS 707.79 TaxID=1448320 RepID=A0A319DK84_9EURO|nr:hypothetical protein BO71DRAFT_101441 [Aspergillus ellipticus CBS 707.79]
MEKAGRKEEEEDRAGTREWIVTGRVVQFRYDGVLASWWGWSWQALKICWFVRISSSPRDSMQSTGATSLPTLGVLTLLFSSM